MWKFSSCDSSKITGRGTIYIIAREQFPQDLDPSLLVNDVAEIDGAEYKVLAVERCGVHHALESPCCLPLGLLV